MARKFHPGASWMEFATFPAETCYNQLIEYLGASPMQTTGALKPELVRNSESSRRCTACAPRCTLVPRCESLRCYASLLARLSEFRLQNEKSTQDLDYADVSSAPCIAPLKQERFSSQSVLYRAVIVSHYSSLSTVGEPISPTVFTQAQCTVEDLV